MAGSHRVAGRVDLGVLEAAWPARCWRPSFFGSFLLLFTNAFSAFATAAVLINLTNPLITLQIKQALISETGLGAPNLAKAEAILMVIVVALVMWVYYRIQRRAVPMAGLSRYRCRCK